jgi:hypothetical protein
MDGKITEVDYGSNNYFIGPSFKRKGEQIMKKLALSILIAIGALALAVMVALAVPPDRLELSENTPYLVTDCGDFLIMNYPETTLQLTFFYDNLGNLKKVNQFWFGEDNLTNSVSGRVITSSFHNHAVFDVKDVTVHQGGVFWHVTSPHQGQVFFESGHYIVEDYNQPEPNITFTGVSNLDITALCSLLSG